MYSSLPRSTEPVYDIVLQLWAVITDVTPSSVYYKVYLSDISSTRIEERVSKNDDFFACINDMRVGKALLFTIKQRSGEQVVTLSNGDSIVDLSVFN